MLLSFQISNVIHLPYLKLMIYEEEGELNVLTESSTDSDELTEIIAHYEEDFQYKSKVFKSQMVTKSSLIGPSNEKKPGEEESDKEEPLQKHPIIWFGSLPDYQKSEVKVLTVAINPSKHEFYSERTPQIENNIDWMNHYFEGRAYESWFKSLDKSLEIFDASFYGGRSKKNRALHTDFQTGIATDPSWGGLKEYQRALIANHDNFSELFDYLVPDFTILYSNLKDFQEVATMFNKGERNPAIYLDDSGNPIDLRDETKDFGAEDFKFAVVIRNEEDSSKQRVLIWVKNNAGTNRKFAEPVGNYLRSKGVEIQPL